MPTMSLYKLGASSPSAPLLPPPLRSTPNSAARFPASSSAALPPRHLHLQQPSRGGGPVRASTYPASRVDPVPEPRFDLCIREVERILDNKDGGFWNQGWRLVYDEDRSHFNGRTLSHECNKAMDELINLLNSAWEVYESLSRYFYSRTSLEGLHGKHIHVESLLDYQAIRGGEPNRLIVPLPVTDFCRGGKTLELKAMKIAQSLEKLSYDKLLNLLIEARLSRDELMEFFLEFEFLDEQFEVMKKISGYVAELEMVGEDDGGLRRFDRALLDEYGGSPRYIASD